MSRPPTAVLVALVPPTAEGLAVLWARLTGQEPDVEAFRVLLAARGGGAATTSPPGPDLAARPIAPPGGAAGLVEALADTDSAILGAMRRHFPLTLPRARPRPSSSPPCSGSRPTPGS